MWGRERERVEVPLLDWTKGNKCKTKQKTRGPIVWVCLYECEHAEGSQSPDCCKKLRPICARSHSLSLFELVKCASVSHKSIKTVSLVAEKIVYFFILVVYRSYWELKLAFKTLIKKAETIEQYIFYKQSWVKNFFWKGDNVVHWAITCLFRRI